MWFLLAEVGEQSGSLTVDQELLTQSGSDVGIEAIRQLVERIGIADDVVDLLVPELQKRGVYKTEYRSGTLREKLFGDGPRLPANHPGAGYRDLSQQRENVSVGPAVPA